MAFTAKLHATVQTLNSPAAGRVPSKVDRNTFHTHHSCIHILDVYHDFVAHDKCRMVSSLSFVKYEYESRISILPKQHWPDVGARRNMNTVK